MTAELILRIVVAGLLGGLIGLEREYRAKEAGCRTHFLVALGSAIFMVLSQYGFMDLLTQFHELNIRLDPSRIASQVVTGIGFIGAGTIIFQKHVVRGLTTAAGLWVTSAIGMTCGSGLYLMAAAGTVLVLMALEAMNYLLHRFGSRSISVRFLSADKENINIILERLRHRGADVVSYTMEIKPLATGTFYEVTLELHILRQRYRRRILDLMTEFEGVTIEEIE